MSDHLCPLALWTAFPSSLAGRYSGDYYGHSVAIGLAPRRRSHVRLRHTSQREVGVPLISFNALTGHRLRRGDALTRAIDQRTAQRRFRAPFRRTDRVASPGDWDSGNPAFAMSRGSPHASLLVPGRDRGFPDMLLSPAAFRREVSHRTQERSLQFLPAELGICRSAFVAQGSPKLNGVVLSLDRVE
jgi:hypothetical protein